MHNPYNDIRKRIPQEPKWWDEHAVPRYCEFTPDEVANIYADQVALVKIGCQECGHVFLVAFSEDPMDRMGDQVDSNPTTLKQSITGKFLHFGDPPNINCCPVGGTMNCEDYRVIEFWERHLHKGDFAWHRNSEFEIELEDAK